MNNCRFFEKIRLVTFLVIVFASLLFGRNPAFAYDINAEIDVRLLDLIDQHADLYYNLAWNVSIDQYKAWIATIAWAEAGKAGYGAHSGGSSKSLKGDLFRHKVLGYDSLFRFSTGIGPFQLDRGSVDYWERWPTGHKIDPEKAVISALHVLQQESPVGYSLRDFAWHSRWLAVNPTAPNYTPGDLSKYWAAVTGTDWDAHAAGPAPLDWPSIKSALAQNAAADPRYLYDYNVESKGLMRWNITAAQNVRTETGRAVIFDGDFPTWLIRSRRHDETGSERCRYYYAFRSDLGPYPIEVWVYDNSQDADRFKYIFIRECYPSVTYGALPDHREIRPDGYAYAGEPTLSAPAIIIGDENPPVVNSFSVSPLAGPLWNPFTINYSVSDTGGSGLNRVELWRANDVGGAPDPDWPDNPIITTPLSGQTSYSSSFTDAPSSPGTYWYGMHVVDNSGDPEHWNDERNSRTGGLPGVYGPIKVTVYLEQQEEVSSPSGISGPSSTYVNKTESYTASGASSNLGHNLEYRFDWGDSNISGWGSATQSYLWSGNGTFHIKAQARCATHTDKVSSWSGTLSTVTVSYLTLSTNVNPSGGGSVTKNPDKSGYDYNESVQLTANSISGYNFSHWQGDPPVEVADLEWMFENPLVGYIMDRNKAIMAIFTLLEQVSTPTFTPSGGTFTDSVDIEISCSTPDITIRYTTDGSTPNSSEGTIYDGTPIHLTETTMIKAVAYKTGMMDSEIAADTYVIRIPMDIYVDDDAPDDPGPGDPIVSDPLEDGTTGHPFDEFQEAIDVALDDDTVIVAEGTYYENLNLNDKDIILTSTAPSNQNVVANTIVNGGGNDSVINFINANVTIAGFTITNGSSFAGGGIYCENSNPTISNCIFSGNIADIAGGGMYMSGEEDNAILTNCIFKGNSAEYGGAIVMDSEIGNNNATLVNCLFFDNSAVFFGGVMDVWNLLGSMDIELINCTLAGNSAPNGNALSFDSDLQAYPSNVQLANSILWNGNDEIWNGDGSTITINYSDVQGGWGGPGENNINVDPSFVEADNDNFHLLAGSQCIDAGNNNALPPDTADLDGDGNTTEPTPWDLDGNPRIIGDEVDMGAYEFQGIIGDFCGEGSDQPDGYVDYWDLLYFAQRWHTEPGDTNWDPRCDLDKEDNYVDYWDLLVFAQQWHKGQKP